MITQSIETITPEIAAVYLKQISDEQRPLNRGNVEFFAQQMIKGNWQLNGEPIIFDTDNKLIDGQHRLHACIRANVPFITAVVRNVFSDAIHSIDTGTGRPLGQILTMKGIPNGNCIAATIKVYLKYQKENIHSIDVVKTSRASAKSFDTNKVSTNDALEVYNKNPNYWQTLVRKTENMYRQCKLMSKSEIAGTLAHLNLTKGYEYEYVLNFFEQIFYEEQTKLNVIRLLRKKLIDSQISKTSKLTGLHKTQLIIKCWEYYKAGKSPSVLKWVEGTEEMRTFE